MIPLNLNRGGIEDCMAAAGAELADENNLFDRLDDGEGVSNCLPVAVAGIASRAAAATNAQARTAAAQSVSDHSAGHHAARFHARRERVRAGREKLIGSP